MSKLGLVLDSTQISAFLECPRLWYYNHILRLRKTTSKHRRRVMDIGSYGHKLLEIYYFGIARGMTRTQALEYAFSYNPDLICECGHTKHDHRPTSTDPLLFDGENCKFRQCNCQVFSQVEALVSKKDESYLRKRLLDYFATYSGNDIVPFSPETVELGFSYELFQSVDRIYVLEGKVDLIGKYAGFNSFTDHKFQERKRDLYDRSIQFRNYALALNIKVAFINYIRLAQEISSDTFQRRIIMFTEPELILWKKRLIDVFDRVAEFLAHADEPGFWTSDASEPNWSACPGKFGYVCDYTTLCEEINPSVVPAKIDQLYTIGKEWKPW